MDGGKIGGLIVTIIIFIIFVVILIIIINYYRKYNYYEENVSNFEEVLNNFCKNCFTNCSDYPSCPQCLTK